MNFVRTAHTIQYTTVFLNGKHCKCCIFVPMMRMVEEFLFSLFIYWFRFTGEIPKRTPQTQRQVFRRDVKGGQLVGIQYVMYPCESRTVEPVGMYQYKEKHSFCVSVLLYGYITGLDLPPAERYVQLRLEYIGAEEFDYHSRASRLQRERARDGDASGALSGCTGTSTSSCARGLLVPRAPFYLLCPARMSVRQLKRFLALRFELDLLPLASTQLQIQLLSARVPSKSSSRSAHAPSTATSQSSPKQLQQTALAGVSSPLSPPLDALQQHHVADATTHDQTAHVDSAMEQSLRSPSVSSSAPSALLTPNASVGDAPDVDSVDAEEDSEEPLAALLSRIVLYSGHAVIPEEHTLADIDVDVAAASTSTFTSGSCGSRGGEGVRFSPPRRSAMHSTRAKQEPLGCADSEDSSTTTSIALFFTVFL